MIGKSPWEDFLSDIFDDDDTPTIVKFDKMIKKKLTNEIKSVFGETIEPEIGSVLFCSLATMAEHTGIYVGDDEVVHLNGDGIIEKVSFDEFVDRLDGWNKTLAINCPVDWTHEPIGDPKVAQRALSLVGKHRNYNLLSDNCHKFTYYCLTGKKLPIVMFQTIEAELKKKYAFRGWELISW